MKAIKIQNLVKHFGTTKAVDDISFEVDQGEIYGFLGPNGAGKSTAINCVMDFLRPTSGRIEILGVDSKTYSPTLRNDIGYLSSEINLYLNWTGKEHIDFVKSVRKVETVEDAIIGELDLDISKKAKSLSSGNKQKLGLVLAMMHNPKLIILDEPTNGLDPILQLKIYKALKRAVKNGSTVFTSSHNLPEVEKICDRVCIIRKGKIANIESISEIQKKRIYGVDVNFSKKINQKEFMLPGVSVIKTFENTIEFAVKGDIKPILKQINKHSYTDISVNHSNLEDVFMEYYK